MHFPFWRRATAAALGLLFASACRPDFVMKRYDTNAKLFRAGLAQFERHKWDNAIAAFEKLTVDLPARDSLLPRAFWYLATAREHQGEHLLAAQSYTKLVESFPDDSLADDAALESARSYARLWRKPSLDPTYGETAVAQYNTLLGLYPNSPLVSAAQRELYDLENKFAIKNYDSGMFYFRRKAFDSAIIYFKDVLSRYPNAPETRVASVRLVEAYRAIRYRQDAADLCGSIRVKYPNDAEVERACAGIPVTAPAASAPVP